MSAQAAEVLRQAAQVVETRGHTKGGYEDWATGAVCMWGAINVCLSGAADSTLKHLADPAYIELQRTFQKRFPLDNCLSPGAYAFNDLPETTGKDVQKFLLSTADEIEFQ